MFLMLMWKLETLIIALWTFFLIQLVYVEDS